MRPAAAAWSTSAQLSSEDKVAHAQHGIVFGDHLDDRPGVRAEPVVAIEDTDPKSARNPSRRTPPETNRK